MYRNVLTLADTTYASRSKQTDRHKPLCKHIYTDPCTLNDHRSSSCMELDTLSAIVTKQQRDDAAAAADDDDDDIDEFKVFFRFAQRFDK